MLKRKPMWILIVTMTILFMSVSSAETAGGNNTTTVDWGAFWNAFISTPEPVEKFDPGFSRWSTVYQFNTYDKLAEQYGMQTSDDWDTCEHRYTPASGKPLNIYMVTHPDCMVGIDGSGRFPVSEKGLVNSITKYMEKWAKDIEAKSNGVIRYQVKTDEADVLIVINQTYKASGSYRGTSGKTVTGFSSHVTFYIYSLSDPALEYTVSRSHIPGKSVSIRGSGNSNFWMDPPELKGSSELDNLVDEIMSWYGYQTSLGSEGVGVRRARQSLIDRRYLQAEPGDSFDEAMESAVRLLQKNYGLEETGVIDHRTLLALYYQQGVVDQNISLYPD